MNDVIKEFLILSALNRYKAVLYDFRREFHILHE